MQLFVRTHDEVDRHMDMVRAAAERTRSWLLEHDGDGLSLLRSLKFDAVGYHPLADRGLNVVEQINQTFTYAVALAATKVLLDRHPDAGGFHLAPGAHASLPLDIMSEMPGLVGAETFAAVTPRNNGKLAGDLAKLAARTETHRYVFFASPLFPRDERLPAFEKNGVEVWSVSL